MAYINNILDSFLARHIQCHYLHYVFIFVLFVMGLIFGALLVVFMHFTQSQELLFFIEQYFDRIIEHPSLLSDLNFTNYFYEHLIYLLILYGVGLSIIGMPLIFLFIFSKGLFMGFTIGFFVHHYGFSGLACSVLLLLPKNIVFIPLYLIASTLAMICSIYLIKRMTDRRFHKFTIKPFLRYSLAFVFFLCIAGIVSMIESSVNHLLVEQAIQFINLE
ncbi:stage II sporulation protein M [Pelagirhabdus alkalitolerans]|uniref:Stage II sporulation protein M n=1 Tax=Pelagirhabdus alkalitolerans TaxID=1612202 RepID=A0A1G6HCC7_9BACI|nr:stage II sporulation protein M [Pelagirhabdus alkalitolerans]SDB91803.1 stage II sporulation protein M [Pelagirhabdus alkalitolerans]